MSKATRSLLFVGLTFGLTCCLAMPLIGQSPAGDAAMLEQLTPDQRAKWNAASEERKAAWRKRWQMRQQSPAPEARVARTRAPNDIGRLRYDTGAPADLISTNGGDIDQMVGNRFTATSVTPTTLTTITITGASLYGRSPTATAASFSGTLTFGAPPAGTTFSVLAIRAATFPRSSLAPVAISSVNVPLNFLAALYQGTFGGSNELGMVTDSRIAGTGTMTTPLGFHAFQADFTAPTATGYAAITGQNAMLRVLGAAILPVELMSFEVE